MHSCNVLFCIRWHPCLYFGTLPIIDVGAWPPYFCTSSTRASKRPLQKLPQRRSCATMHSQLHCCSSRLHCYVFCFCLLTTNKYQKYKSVELGDQLLLRSLNSSLHCKQNIAHCKQCNACKTLHSAQWFSSKNWISVQLGVMNDIGLVQLSLKVV